MSLFKTVVLVLAAIASTDALATHNARGISHHQGLGRRMPQVLAPEVAVPVKKRNLRKRCRVRPSLVPNGPVGNVGADPIPSPSSTKSPTKAPTQAAATPPPQPTRTRATAAQPPKNTVKPPTGGNFPDFLSGTNTGEATYYGTGLGACGITSTDNDMIVAVSQLLFDIYPGYKGGNPNNNPICGREIDAHLHGKSVRVKVVDRCVGCKQLDLDFSPAAFNKIGRVAVGREKGMTWNWV